MHFIHIKKASRVSLILLGGCGWPLKGPFDLFSTAQQVSHLLSDHPLLPGNGTCIRVVSMPSVWPSGPWQLGCHGCRPYGESCLGGLCHLSTHRGWHCGPRPLCPWPHSGLQGTVCAWDCAGRCRPPQSAVHALATGEATSGGTGICSPTPRRHFHHTSGPGAAIVVYPLNVVHVTSAVRLHHPLA